jgi:virulence factor Mce-like protein
VEKRVLTRLELGAMVAFGLSCFAIVIFLWISFGGSTPLSAKGYRMVVDFHEAPTLVPTADVRISGVTVGRVASIELHGDRTRATLEIDREYAPRPADSRAVLRIKTLIAETYVELTPGTSAAPDVPDGGTLAVGNVAETVQLDEIFRSFDPPTRQAFKDWLDRQGRALAPHGRDLNAALARVVPFEDASTTMLSILGDERRDVRRLVRGTGTVFGAVSERDAELRHLIENSNRVFATTAARNQDLSDAVTVLPTFLAEARATTRRVTAFSRTAHPLVRQLRPAARELAPTLADLEALTPDLDLLFTGLGPLIAASRAGVPALEGVLDDLEPVLAQLDPFLRNVNPVVEYLGLYEREVAAFFANGAAAGQAVDRPGTGRSTVHYLRLSNPINLENLAAYPRRLPVNRTNPYTAPGGYDKAPIDVFGSYLCTGGPLPQLVPVDAPGATDFLSAETLELVQRLVIDPAGAAPPCTAQAPLGNLLGQPGAYPQLTADPSAASAGSRRSASARRR